MKKDENLTPWFDGDTKPVHAGVYERRPTLRTGVEGRFSLWQGAYWCLAAGTAEEARDEYHASSEQRTPWRGLTRKAT